jgi:hypothetical protein
MQAQQRYTSKGIAATPCPTQGLLQSGVPLYCSLFIPEYSWG